MSDHMMECMTNPVACRMLLEVMSKERVTAKQLAEVNDDIPQTSLYRYLKKMTDSGILEVVETHQIRGTVEKVYAVSAAFSDEIKSMVQRNDAQAYLALFTQYMIGLLREFKEYASRKEINIVEDCSGFTLTPAYLTKAEWEQAASEIGDILTRLMQQEKTQERRLHTVGLIMTPPKNME